jgi:hypothetical protein
MPCPISEVLAYRFAEEIFMDKVSAAVSRHEVSFFASHFGHTNRNREVTGRMEKYHIAFTEEESALLSKIDLRSDHQNHDEGHAAYLANREPILALLKLLSARRAVPAVRLSYWNDPNYRSGRVKGSRKALFERNGCTGADIYIHPHFLEHLRYLLFGSELPHAVIEEFEKRVGNPEWVSSSDIVPLGKAARDLTRRYRLDIAAAPEEFFKLCLDMGLGLSVAESVMRAVKQIR